MTLDREIGRVHVNDVCVAGSNCMQQYVYHMALNCSRADKEDCLHGRLQQVKLGNAAQWLRHIRVKAFMSARHCTGTASLQEQTLHHPSCNIQKV